MKIDSIQVGPIMTNCYLLCDDAAGVCCVIDPGDEPARVEQMVQRSGCELRYILLTHGHFDHCTGVAGMLERHPELPVYICEKDVTDGVGSEMQFARLPEKNQRYYKDGDTLTLGALTISVLETPGHTPGSVCLLVGDVMFAGDTLFRGSCDGRTSPAATTVPCCARSGGSESSREIIRSTPATSSRRTSTLSAASIPTCSRAWRNEADFPRP